jgi:hypothetical protein
MSENQIIPAETLGVNKYDDDAFDSVAKASAFLPRVLLCGGSTGIVKKGKFPVNNYGLSHSKDNVDVLGTELDVWVLAWRPKAISFENEVINTHDHTSEEYKRIDALKDTKDSGCQAGPEFLFYLPKEGKFATMFFASKTLRRAAPEVKGFMGKLVTLGIEIIEVGNYIWPGPLMSDCVTPHDLPPADELAEEMNKFNNPPKPTVERDEPDGRER